MDRKKLFDSFPNENDALAKAMDLIAASKKTGKPQFTSFLDPHLCDVVFKAFSKEVLIIDSFGGYSEALRRIVSFGDASEVDYPITAIEITQKSELSHRDYLGAILSLGISRDVVGDIIVTSNKCTVFVLKKIAEYIVINLSKIGNQNVSAKIIDLGELDVPEQNFVTISKTVAAPRLDAVVSVFCNLARNKALELVEGDRVQVNYRSCATASKLLKEGDVLTVRGFGKAIFTEGGTSKKGRMFISLKKYQ